MTELNELIMEQLHWFVVVMIMIILILWITVIVQGAKLRGMRRRYDAMMAGSGVEDLESLLVQLKVQIDEIEEGQADHQKMLDSINRKLKGMKSRVGIVRYNAYGERGNEMSFSLAIVSDQEEGIVLTGLHNRESSYVYAKPLKDGQSKYPLSPEEKEALTLALQEG
ncbi:DUF4446 family protein [Paenibacillus ihbetae]|uniref:DUF4446 domain-containing protein n=1 Tax=Paenibacillus ihbetae TaxID=1870820 RepID=A0A1B2E0W2_9BACL|nr:DUF4446 family protein [Paenibacillus ihbetae]ANY73654.1 hypothetical protein BBD41_14320 [Paenibacillus ihbetae]OOC57624.1 hypothetical protein BBD40_28360 [Paenibacillus ihbetae]